MQYTSKLAILAVALFSTSALAAPFASFDAESELEVREADNELSAREFFDAYLEAREDPSLDARDLEALDLEAREYLEYLEMREAAASTATPATPTGDHSTPSSPSPSPTQSPPQSPMSGTHSQQDEEHPHFALLQQHRAAAVKAAKLQFQDPSAYKEALTDSSNPLHKMAVRKYLHQSDNMTKALGDKHSLYYKAAKRMAHRQKANAFFEANSKNMMRALKSSHHKYHKDAVKLYFTQKPAAFEKALSSKHARLHKEAVHQYLSDSAVRKAIIAKKSGDFYKAAVKMQKKLDAKHKHKHGKKHSSTPATTSSTTSATPSATHAA